MTGYGVKSRPNGLASRRKLSTRVSFGHLLAWIFIDFKIIIMWHWIWSSSNSHASWPSFVTVWPPNASRHKLTVYAWNLRLLVTCVHFTSRLANPFSRPSQVRTQVGWICKVASIVFEVFRVYTRELSQTVSPHHFFLFQAYYRQGVALQCLGRHAEALAAFAAALAQDPKSSQLLAALTEAAMKSPLKGWYCARCLWGSWLFWA